MSTLLKKISVWIVFSVIALSISYLSPPAVVQGQGGFPPAKHTDWGHPEPLGDGEIQTFVSVNPAGKPMFVGVRLTAQALEGLPQAPSDGRWDVVDADGNVVIPCCGHETLLTFPDSIAATPFLYFVLNWNPFGHPPPRVYTEPHFDFHFYTMPNEDRLAITAPTAEEACRIPVPPNGSLQIIPVDCETFATATKPLPPEVTPPDYISIGAVEPGMGNHLVDPTSPEFNDKTFTHTWIYGAYDGEITFYEPMITTAFFAEKNEEVCTSIKTPEAMSQAGYFPTEYCIRYQNNRDAYLVTLEGFEWFETP